MSARTAMIALLLSLAAALAFASEAGAAEWTYDEDNIVAQVEQSGYLFRVHCADREEIVVVYQIPMDDVSPELKKRKTAYLIITADQDKAGHGHAYAFSSNVVAGDHSYLIGFGGADALRMAEKISQATDNITVGVSAKKTAGGASDDGVTSFPTAGAFDTISRVQLDCPD